jgi:hypothetical protein
MCADADVVPDRCITEPVDYGVVSNPTVVTNVDPVAVKYRPVVNRRIVPDGQFLYVDVQTVAQEATDTDVNGPAARAEDYPVTDVAILAEIDQ